MHGGLHHMHVRKRIYQNLEAFPHQSLFKRSFDKLIYVTAILSPLALVPQVWNIFATQNVSGISLSSWVLYTGIQLLWTIYGILHKDVPIFVSSLGFLVLNVLGVIGVLLYQAV